MNRLPGTLFLLAIVVTGLLCNGAWAASGATPVCFYEHADFQGDSFCATDSQSWVGNAWNDRISSVKVPPGASVTLYEDVGMGGQSVFLDSDVSNLTSLHFNDSASSFTLTTTQADDACVANVAFTEQAASTVAATDKKFCQMRGLWVWNTRQLLADGAQAQIFLQSVHDLGATDVFLYLTAEDYGSSRASLRGLVSRLKAIGIAAWGLDGSRDYFSDGEGPTRLFASVDALVQYNAAVLPQERFAGFQSDMEPQDTTGFRASFHNELRDDQLDQKAGGVWQSSQALDREMLMRDWLDIHNTCRNKLTAAGLKFSAAMPFWTEDYYGAPVMVTYGGERASVGRQMMKSVHDYVIMSYNTDPANAAARAAVQVQMASALPFDKRPRVSAAVETHPGIGSHISYADTPGKNARHVVLQDIDQIRAALDTQPAFGGVSVHDWQGWQILPP